MQVNVGCLAESACSILSLARCHDRRFGCCNVAVVALALKVRMPPHCLSGSLLPCAVAFPLLPGCWLSCRACLATRWAPAPPRLMCSPTTRQQRTGYSQSPRGQHPVTRAPGEMQGLCCLEQSMGRCKDTLNYAWQESEGAEGQSLPGKRRTLILFTRERRTNMHTVHEPPLQEQAGSGQQRRRARQAQGGAPPADVDAQGRGRQAAAADARRVSG